MRSAVLPSSYRRYIMAELCSRCSKFESEDPSITCVALDGGSCSACQERTTIRGQIKQLEKELAKLKAKYDTLTTTMNSIHDPFIHKLPPEIGSRIFRLSLPTFDNGKCLEEILKPWGDRSSARILRLGAVCRMWRQLAWATPNLWNTLYLFIRSGTRDSLAESLPDLVRDWLERSGSLPLTISFQHHPRSVSYEDEDTFEAALGLVIEILILHSRRWRILNLATTADMFRRFSGSILPNQLIGLGLQLIPKSFSHQPPDFMIESEFTPTHLMLGPFPLTSVNVRWDNISHLTLCTFNDPESVDVLRRALNLEYYNISMYQLRRVTSTFSMPVVHPRLRSITLTGDIEDFLEAIALPSLEEWTQSIEGENLPVAAMVSLFKRSGCHLKVLDLADFPDDSRALNILLQAMPSLERIELTFDWRVSNISTIMDDVLARIFHPAPDSSNISVEEPTHQSFLPRLQYMCCKSPELVDPFSWERIPQLYRGHRRSLVVNTVVNKADITDETAFQLLQLADEGLDLQIFDASMGGYFLDIFRKRTFGQIV
jgi:hypothetical protein